MELYIEALEKNCYFAYTQSPDEKHYVLGNNKKPLRFISVQHVKEYFEGYKFDKIAILKQDSAKA